MRPSTLPPTLLVLLLCTSVAHAEVYTWVDADGNTHYSDKPPADQSAEQLDLDTETVTTVGGSGLRPGELALLEQIREDDRAARERRLRANELALLAEQRRLAEQERASLAEPPPAGVTYGPVYSYPYAYPLIPRRIHKSKPRFGLNLEYRDDNFRLRGDFHDRGRDHSGPPRRPPHRFKHRDRGVTKGISNTVGQ